MRSVQDRLAVALVAAAAFPPSVVIAAATPAPAPRVLRHLVFNVGVDIENRTDTKVSGIEGPASGTASDVGTQIEKGTISVDVVAVTGDGGIVVDVSEDTDTRKAGVARVAILGSAVSYDPSRDVTEEEVDILRFLSRTFVKDGEISVGTAWTTDAQSGIGSDHAVYAVTAVDADAKTIDISVDEKTTQIGPKGFDGTTRGSVKYDMGVLVPISFSLDTRRQGHPGLGQLLTVETKVTSSLAFDSFHKAAN
jgi:hypothetical protein